MHKNIPGSQVSDKKKNYTVSHTADEKKIILLKQNPVCTNCFNTLGSLNTCSHKRRILVQVGIGDFKVILLYVISTLVLVVQDGFIQYFYLMGNFLCD